MAINRLIAEKERILEELLRLTAQMHECLMKNEAEKFEIELTRRGALFQRLSTVDAGLAGHETPHDALWMKQLRMIESSDTEIVQFLQLHKQRILKEEESETQTKRELLKTSQVEAKGNRIQVRG